MTRRIWFVGAGLVLLVTVLAGAYLSARYRALEDQLAQYEGVKVGSSRAEVKYLRGDPTAVFGPVEKTPTGMPRGWSAFQAVYYLEPKNDPSETKVNALPDGKSAADFDEWSYEQASGANIDVKFASGRASSIRCVDIQRGNGCAPILGISLGSTEERLLATLGKPGSEEIDEDSGTKTIAYPDMGLSFRLEQRQVYFIEVTAPKGEGKSARLLRALLTER